MGFYDLLYRLFYSLLIALSLELWLILLDLVILYSQPVSQTVILLYGATSFFLSFFLSFFISMHIQEIEICRKFVQPFLSCVILSIVMTVIFA